MKSQIVAAAVPFVLLLSARAQEAPRVSEEARQQHQEAFVFDGHVHMVNRQLHLGGNIGARLPDGQVDLPRMKEGGVDAFFMTLFVMEQYYPARYETKQTLRLMNMALDQLEQHRDVVELALNASDIERINRAGKMAAVLDLEGGFDLDGDLDVAVVPPPRAPSRAAPRPQLGERVRLGHVGDGDEKARLSIYDIDRRLAPQFPMVGPVAPDEVLMSVDDWVGVVDRAIQVAGEDHVALGSDFDGGPTPARHMRDVRDLAMITDAMLRRGYSKDRIRKFLGGNLMRVFRQVTSNPG